MWRDWRAGLGLLGVAVGLLLAGPASAQLKTFRFLSNIDEVTGSPELLPGAFDGELRATYTFDPAVSDESLESSIGSYSNAIRCITLESGGITVVADLVDATRSGSTTSVVDGTEDQFVVALASRDVQVNGDPDFAIRFGLNLLAGDAAALGGDAQPIVPPTQNQFATRHVELVLQPGGSGSGQPSTTVRARPTQAFDVNPVVECPEPGVVATLFFGTAGIGWYGPKRRRRRSAADLRGGHERDWMPRGGGRDARSAASQ